MANWWNSGGASGCVAAYQPRGAASYADSKLDLTGNGHNAFGGVAPAWDTENGWTGDGIGKYLRTGLAPHANWTHLTQFTNGPASGTVCVAGSDGQGPTGFFAFTCQQYYGPAEVMYAAGNNFRKSPALLAGNLGGVAKVIDPGGGYRNGVFEAGVPTAAGTANGWSEVLTPGYEIYLLCVNSQGAAQNFFPGNLQAYAVYDNALTDAQMLAVATAMSLIVPPPPPPPVYAGAGGPLAFDYSATMRVSVKRLPAMSGTPPTRGAPTVILTGVPCLPFFPASPQLRARTKYEEPAQLLETYSAYAMQPGDELVDAYGTSYPVMYVGPWLQDDGTTLYQVGLRKLFRG